MVGPGKELGEVVVVGNGGLGTETLRFLWGGGASYFDD